MTKASAHHDIDWGSLLRKLTAVAVNLFRGRGLYDPEDSVMSGLGQSAPDFARDAMVEFLSKRDRYPATNDDEGFAITVTILKNNFIDALRRHAYKKGVDIAQDKLDETRDAIPAKNDGFTEFEANVLAEEYYKYTNGDSGLKDIIDATALLAVSMDGPLKRQDVAALLEISVDEVTKRNARLKYNFHAVDRKKKGKTVAH